ncbi:MAG TPA: hypothetical protein PKY27_03990 [Arachnia sp.]|jgi:hypothetical protein|nr:hypothetical protein [Propionibacteriaceae bacterium]HQD21396.1 hypothetical protein [Arachnia sp.]
MRPLARKAVLVMGILATITGLIGCGSSPSVDHDALEADLRSRLEQIQESEVVKADWFRSGLAEAIEVELQLERDDQALGEDVASQGMDAIAETAVAAGFQDDATIKLWVRGTDGEVFLRARDFGHPDVLSKLLESR